MFVGHTHISLVFLEGVHNLSYNFNISGLNLNVTISLLNFQGQGSLPGDTVIRLLPSASISLSDITNVQFLNIHVEAIQQVTRPSYQWRQLEIPENPLNVYQNPQIVYRNIKSVKFFRIETENISTILSDAYVNSIESSFNNSAFIFTSNTTTDSVSKDCESTGSGDCSQLQPRLYIQNCSIANLQVFCTLFFWNITVYHTDIRDFVISNAESLIQDSRFVGGLYGVAAVNPLMLVVQDCDFQKIEEVNIFVDQNKDISSAEVWIENSTFFGGNYGVYVEGIDTSIINCEFNNTLSEAVYITIRYIQANFFKFASTVSIQNCRVSDGDILTYGRTAINIWNCTVEGGAIRSHYASTADIQNCRVTRGEISTFGRTAVNIWNCTVEGGAIRPSSASTADIQNCRVTSGRIIIYTDRTYGSTTVNIWNCTVESGEIWSYYASTVDIQYCTMAGGNISIVTNNNVSIQNCEVVAGQISASSSTTFNIQDCVLHGISNYTTGFLAPNGVAITQVHRLTIQNTTISEYPNFGITVIAVDYGTIDGCFIKNNPMGVASVNSNLNIKNTNITENSFGLVILAAEFMGTIGENLTVFISNCRFSGNSEIGLQLMNLPSGIVITDCRFYENRGSSIAAYQSSFELRGENSFRDNTAKRGGGLVLFNSTVIFGTESKTIFANNKVAEYGGAIYIATLSILSFFSDLLTVAENVDDSGVRSLLTTNHLLKQSCFFIASNESNITFIGNIAALGGNDIYGATLYAEDCNPVNNSNFNIGDKSLDTYRISSDPTRVCFCVDNSPQCERTFFMLNETRYPGETFTISVALAGYNFGRVAGSVYTNVLGRDYSGVIDSKRQHIQTVNLMDCGTLTFTLFSNQTSTQVVLVLTAEEQTTLEQDETDIQTDLRNVYSDRCSDSNFFSCTALLTTPIYINVMLQDCPLGFDLDRDNRVCGCDETLSKRIGTNQTCEIVNQTGYITRQGTVWVGVDTSENNTDIYYWHRYCPTGYCDSSQTSFELGSPDKQCSSHRSGILCGGCQPGFSLQLGGNKCIKCKNSYLALLIVFAVLGILLVAVIKLLDLTITSGTISGLRF